MLGGLDEGGKGMVGVCGGMSVLWHCAGAVILGAEGAGRGSGFIFVSLTMGYLVARFFGFDSHNSVIDHGLFCSQTYEFDPHCCLRASSPGCGIDLEVHFLS